MTKKWDTVEISAGRTVAEDECQVCVRVYGLKDEECPDLPSFVVEAVTVPLSLDHFVSTPVVACTPKCRRPSSACAVSINESDHNVFDPESTDSPSPWPSKCLRSVSFPSPLSTPQSSTKRRSLFPSQYSFAKVYNYARAVMTSGLTLEAVLVTCCSQFNVSCKRSGFNKARAQLEQGTPAIWARFLQLGDTPATSWPLYCREIEPHRNLSKNTLPWQARGFQYSSKSSTCSHCLFM